MQQAGKHVWQGRNGHDAQLKGDSLWRVVLQNCEYPHVHSMQAEIFGM